jgi:hypothetical protein
VAEAEESRKGDALVNVWFSPEQEEEEQMTMQAALTPDRLSVMARSREKLNTVIVRCVVAVAIVLAAGLLYNVYSVDQPWIRIGQAWTLGVLVYLFVPEFERGRRRRDINEPCANFLERQHEERRRSYLRIRRRLFLFLPGIIACWWGRSSLPVHNAGGETLSWLSRLEAGPWLFLITGTALVFVWLAFAKAAEKAARERDKIVRRIGR